MGYFILSVLGVAFGLGFVTVMLLLGLFVGLYILLALGLYTISKNNGFENIAFLAFIPVANFYLMGMIGGDIVYKNFMMDVKYVAILLAILPLFTSVSGLAGTVITVLNGVLYGVNSYNICRKIQSGNALVTAIFSAFIPFVMPIYLFINRRAIFSDEYIVY